jgi:hypothetical protein
VNPQWPGGPPPGWYPDPAGEKAWRWWDGHQWTAYASDPSPPGVGDVGGAAAAPAPAYATPTSPGYQQSGYPGYPGPPSVHERFAAEQKAAPWAKRALAGYLLVIVVTALLAWAESSTLREVFHNLRIQVDTGVVQSQTNNNSATLNLFSLLNLMVEVPVYVLFLTWQYKAAVTARLLRIPARRSPGLGVGSWFIPVVGLWFPYQAIRDCLPPEDPGRRAVARMWACFIATAVMNLATSVLAWVGTPIGFATAAVALGFGAGFAVQGSRAVQRIADCHRQIL